MTNRFIFLRNLFLFSLMITFTFGFYACSDDNNDPIEKDDDEDNDSGEVVTASTFFISVMGKEYEYLMLSEEIESGEISISQNIKELVLSGYTWIFNTNPSAAIGLIYNWGDPGAGLGYGVSSNGGLSELGSFQITTRFTSYGFFDKYALTSVGGQTLVDSNRSDAVLFNFIDLENNLSMEEKAVSTFNITGNGEQATFSGIVDMGNGTFLTGMVLSGPKDENGTGGASTGVVSFPDSVWVAAFDKDLNLKNIYKDDRISYSAGRYRSQYYSQIGKTDAGTVYVFSGSYDYNANATSRPCGALKINQNADEFDTDYYFNIEALSEGYRFRKIWYVTEDYFMLEFYNHTGRVNDIDNPATQYAIVNMSTKTLNWIGGSMPSKEDIVSTGQPMAYEGKMYFPITAGSDSPTIYVIDPITATATKGLVVSGAVSIRAIGRLVED